MSFLQPVLLLALPLIALPVVIHLVNQRRHRSVEWAAMMFLVRAKKMNTGMARLRNLVILALRVVALAALIFALSRPLSTGMLGRMGVARVDSTVVVLDRSPSMEWQDLETGASKRSTALAKLSELLALRGFGNELILIDSARQHPVKVESPDDLPRTPEAQPTATAANIPDLLERAANYLFETQAGRADVWVCSDLQASDWHVESSRWTSLRDQLSSFKGLQLYLLSYPKPSVDENLSIRVNNVRQLHRGVQTELVLDIIVECQDLASGTKSDRTLQSPSNLRTLPVELELNHVKSNVQLEIDNSGGTLEGYRIPIDANQTTGWGSVTLPNDANLADNQFFFVYSVNKRRRATVLAESEEVAQALRQTLEIAAEPGLTNEVDVRTETQVDAIDWESTACLIWQAALPSGGIAEQLQRFVESGRSLLFLPPTRQAVTPIPSGRESPNYMTARWEPWRDVHDEHQSLKWWNNDSDLLAKVNNGDPLPLSDLRVFNYRPIRWLDSEADNRKKHVGLDVTPLATLQNEQPMFMRVPTDTGHVYFCHTLPTQDHSTLEADAIAFYVVLQRLLEQGASSLSLASQYDAQPGVLPNASTWTQVSERSSAVTPEVGLQAGVFRSESTSAWAAINRPSTEDDPSSVNEIELTKLFNGLPLERINDDTGNARSLASEIWRAFLLAMLFALMIEAWLCLPEARLSTATTTSIFGKTQARETA